MAPALYGSVRSKCGARAASSRRDSRANRVVKQTLGAYVQTLASQYNDSTSSYKAAAEEFRIPYWDWADDYRLPASTMEQRITVTIPLINILRAWRMPFWEDHLVADMNIQGERSSWTGRHTQSAV